MNADSIAQLLPAVVRRTRTPGSVLDGALGVMDQLHEPVELLLVDFDRYIDPYRCPPSFVPYLAEWVGLGWLVGARDDGADFPTGDGPLRHLIAEADALAKARGTLDGLLRMLELASAQPGFEIDVDEDHAFHITVNCPDAVRRYQDLITLIIRHEKPAFVTADLAFGEHPSRRLGATHHLDTTSEEDNA